MNPLARHVAHLVGAQDALVLAHGGAWKDMLVRTSSCGGSGPELRWMADPRTITIIRSPDGPGKVTWAELADLIRSGLTDEITADLEAAAADWFTFNHDPANRGDLTYSSCVDRFSELRDRIIANALGAEPVGQLSLFGAVA